ncbi:MAG: hemerythrin domain-containing protein [Burkholderiales bacterium]
MTGAAITLAEHHRHCEALFAEAADAASAGDWKRILARLGALREALLMHFRYEEERIFPLYEQASGQEGATESLCAQHDDLRAALWTLATYSTAADLQPFRAELAELRTAFDAHAADEERRMYPVFERMLAAGLLRP